MTGDGKVITLDAKFNFDSNAVPSPGRRRHARPGRRRSAEIEASKFDLAYISLDGDIGCLVNGAGLAMARWTPSSSTAANRPNFPRHGRRLPPPKLLTEAFKIMLKNPNLKAILAGTSSAAS